MKRLNEKNEEDSNESRNKKSKNLMIDLCDDEIQEIVSRIEQEEQQKVVALPKPVVELVTEQLSESQAAALADVLAGKNVFITGGAGTGKSFLIERIKKELDERDIEYRVTASTGSAAYNIGGTTLHAFAGIGLGQDSIDWTVKQLKKYDEKVDRLRKTRVLIIDEVSMIDHIYFDKINEVCKRIRNTSRLAFGGIQFVLVGDFLQIPPVPNKKQPATDKRRYIFQTDTWKELGLKLIKLRTNFRQQEDDRFKKLLDWVRVGHITEEEMKLLTSRDISALSKSLLPEDKETTKLFSYRNDVHHTNNIELSKIDSPSQRYEAEKYLCPALIEKQQQQEAQYGPSKAATNTSAYPVEESIELKVGASVLLCGTNLDMNCGLFNGCRGIVTGFTESNLSEAEKILGSKRQSCFPKVEFYNAEKRTIKPVVWEQRDGKVLMSSFTQIPLMLAYAVTIHRSQGLTLNAAQVAMKFFECGQAYVALSRVRALENLYLTNFVNNPKAKEQIMADPVVIKFYTENGLF